MNLNWDRNNISYRSNLTNNELGQVSDQIKRITLRMMMKK